MRDRRRQSVPKWTQMRDWLGEGSRCLSNVREHSLTQAYRNVLLADVPS